MRYYHVRAIEADSLEDAHDKLAVGEFYEETPLDNVVIDSGQLVNCLITEN